MGQREKPLPAILRDQEALPWPGPTRRAISGSSAGMVTTRPGKAGHSNDVWKFSPTTLEWEWVSGSYTARQNGTYGTEGTAAAANVPGGRSAAMSWIDSSGNFWLFGGNGCDSIGTGSCDEEQLNDLWKYNPTSNEWTWVSGSKTANADGSYGTEGTAAASNVPGARTGGSTWTDSSGDLWLFGGLTVGGDQGNNDFNDLWKFSTSSGQWTWMGGTDAGGSNGAAAATYGTEGDCSCNQYSGRARRQPNLDRFFGECLDLRRLPNRLLGLWRLGQAQRPLEVHAVMVDCTERSGAEPDRSAVH